ncbi:MAG: hypothetical protein A2X86_18990 [Bdellovibrionales bacterium GWA2_49_15]|nr:MAG: hypothetical protein A2X86_18990 [Bdellovibrionales bacterium GWA2_49_15]HAZ14313.1 hypothetical protein [Bdellovibrionales bacterium]
MKQIFIVAFAMACITLLSCNSQNLPTLAGVNVETGIPYSTTDTVEAMEGTQAVYNGSMSRWRDRTASPPPSTSMEAYPTGRCIRPNAGFAPADLAREFMSKSQRYRESLGGPGCSCVPMGEMCLPNICNCSEICPNDHGIFRNQASQMMPTPGNQLAYGNYIGSGGPFSTYPNKDGFCTGMQLQRRKFSSMARFRPNLYSRPAMTVPGPEYVSYIKREIDRMMAGQEPNFLGAANLTELRRKDPQIDAYFRAQTGADALGAMVTGGPGPDPFVERVVPPVVDGDSYTPRRGSVGAIRVHFAQPTATNIPAYHAQDTDIDPTTNAAYGNIPVPGTTEYVNYMKKKVERVCQGFPAVIPGYADLFALGEFPAYQGIMGRYAAIDWQHMNALDDRYAPGAPPFRGNDWPTRSYQPMSTSESDTLLEGLEDRLPQYPGSGSPWNASGPWQSVSLEFKGSNVPAVGTGSGNGTFYHSVEAYALSPQPNGDVRVCIADPNHGNSSRNSSSTRCTNYMTIPAKGSGGQRAGMAYNSPGFGTRVLGKVGIQPSSDHYQGLMTTRMVEYCRTTNRGKFNVDDCGGTP